MVLFLLAAPFIPYFIFSAATGGGVRGGVEARDILVAALGGAVYVPAGILVSVLEPALVLGGLEFMSVYWHAVLRDHAGPLSVVIILAVTAGVCQLFGRDFAGFLRSFGYGYQFISGYLFAGALYGLLVINAPLTGHEVLWLPVLRIAQGLLIPLLFEYIGKRKFIVALLVLGGVVFLPALASALLQAGFGVFGVGLAVLLCFGGCAAITFRHDG